VDLFLNYVAGGLLVGSTYAVVAVGFALTFSVLRVINNAHPDMVMIAMFAGLFAALNFGNNVLIVFIVGAAAAGVAGLIIERTCMRPLRSAGTFPVLIATTGVSIALIYGAQAIYGSDPVPFPRLLESSLVRIGPIHVTSLQLMVFGIAATILVAISLYVRRTRLGLATRAIADHRDIAATFGVDVVRVSQITVAIASVAAGLAGVSLAILYGNVIPFVGLLYSLKSWTVMLVAGNRHIEAVVLVALLLGVLEALVGGYVSTSYKDAVAFVVLIGVLYFRPTGLFGSYE
jgi:branched-chain amino acid transport system permease protein